MIIIKKKEKTIFISQMTKKINENYKAFIK